MTAPIDPDFWPSLLIEMRASGILYKSIAAHLRCHPSTITLWVQGVNSPGFWHAIDLLAFARRKGIHSAVTQVETITARLS
ncbi:hypothetical protein UFOVP1165_5 [uncultured Caudovirales phage]|uniref:Uncharacterized protein n=1 Tax=uncultured Caudovirales phage TaxID=2100421 RepID=A0A6J5QWH0_9CAUD|nr:hypothetical protein UFOVP1165_5 [uncultured Caudovirales phage]